MSVELCRRSIAESEEFSDKIIVQFSEYIIVCSREGITRHAVTVTIQSHRETLINTVHTVISRDDPIVTIIGERRTVNETIPRITEVSLTCRIFVECERVFNGIRCHTECNILLRRCNSESIAI